MKTTAEITLAFITSSSIHALYHIDIEGKDSASSNVAGYYSSSINDGWKLGVEDSKEWATGNTKVCRYKDL